MSRYIQVLTTAGNREEANEIAEKIVSERLAACVQVIAAESTYRWKGRVEKEAEYLCIIKTTQLNFKELEEFIRKIHPYQTPEILSVPILSGNPEYLDWLEKSVK